MDAPIDENTKRTVQKIPLLTTRAGPRDGESWTKRLKEEYLALIQYVKMNKEADNDWFTIESKTSKMYRGGKICLTIHFAPLWQKNVPRFGVAHALALGLAPWLAAEVPDLVERGVITPV
ncbi:Histone-lysine N-methyltransferase ATX3 [Phytophthora nicotianae]|uniref:Ubiquitin-fold modifier-conjugating enzyme 1 n=1 Tax=Phytophthora nicotianae TaxID=4792 RepID=A0A0W8D8P3_PHYNI|nr:Histone-lysine N-methyltransferase ATX3 [Phytophthora nicotianae]